MSNDNPLSEKSKERHFFGHVEGAVMQIYFISVRNSLSKTLYQKNFLKDMFWFICLFSASNLPLCAVFDCKPAFYSL